MHSEVSITVVVVYQWWLCAFSAEIQRLVFVTNLEEDLLQPLYKIYNQIAQSGEWPTVWKIEHGIPLKKCPNPMDEDDLRVISLTAFFSKVFEEYIIIYTKHEL